MVEYKQVVACEYSKMVYSRIHFTNTVVVQGPPDVCEFFFFNERV